MRASSTTVTYKDGRKGAYLSVGCRGFAGQSLCYTALGITGERKKRAIYNSTEAAEKASRWIWIKRVDPWESAARAQAGA